MYYMVGPSVSSLHGESTDSLIHDFVLNNSIRTCTYTCTILCTCTCISYIWMNVHACT